MARTGSSAKKGYKPPREPIGWAAGNNCGNQCGNGHVLLKVEVKGETVRDLNMDSARMMDTSEEITVGGLDKMLAETRQSDTTISIMSYYTPQFRQKFSNNKDKAIQEIKTYIASTNQAFKHSKIPVELKYYDCSFEELDISENENDNDRLDKFENAKGHVAFLLKSHDLAMLVTKDGVSMMLNY